MNLEHLSEADREFVKQITQQLSSGQPGLSVIQVQHDAWCKFFATGSPSDCNCNPDHVLVPVEEK